jgi:hypothetical protein
MVVPVLIPPAFDLICNRVVSTVVAPPTISVLKAGLVVPIPTFCEVSIVTAVVPLLVANCNEPELSP